MGHSTIGAISANWRCSLFENLQSFANGAISAIGAKLAKIKLRNRVYTYLRIANWRCRQLALKVGAISATLAPISANWRH